MAEADNVVYICPILGCGWFYHLVSAPTGAPIPQVVHQHREARDMSMMYDHWNTHSKMEMLHAIARLQDEVARLQSEVAALHADAYRRSGGDQDV